METEMDSEADERIGVSTRAFAESQTRLESTSDEGYGNVLQRSSLLKRASAVVFGFTAAALLPNSQASAAPPEAPCYGFINCAGGCCDRDGAKRCFPSCQTGYLGCHSGPPNLCWASCLNGKLYRCCTCQSPGHPACTCRFLIGECV